MAFSFNIIACNLPLPRGVEFEAAGLVFARVIKNRIRCPHCGTYYSLIVPASGSVLELEVEQLLAHVRYTCGDHPPLIQKQ